MTDKISSGAYVIRNRHSLTVLHIEAATFGTGHTRVLAFEQDENQYRDSQVWWIEPLSDPGDDGGGTLYSITNTSCGKILDECSGGEICATKPHGAPWQAWKIQRVKSGDDGAGYTIIGARTGQVIGIGASAIDTKDKKAVPKSSSVCHIQRYIPDDDQNSWEFVIPLVSFPVGWFQIRNAETRDLLYHKYLYSPPVLLPPPDISHLSQHLESWGTQWTLARTETISPNYKHTTGGNTWYIINRLTGGLLSNGCNPNFTSRTRKVVALGMAWADEVERVWKLELDPASNWTIMHHHTSLLLEQTEVPRGGGEEVACIHKRFNSGTRNRSWVFHSNRTPGLEKSDEVRAYFQGLKVGNGSEEFFVPRGLTVETFTKV